MARILSFDIPTFVIVLALVFGAIVIYKKFGDRILNAANVV